MTLNREAEERQSRESFEQQRIIPNPNQPKGIDNEIDKWAVLIDRAMPVLERFAGLAERFMDGRNQGINQRNTPTPPYGNIHSGFRVQEEGIVPFNQTPQLPPTVAQTQPNFPKDDEMSEDIIVLNDGQLEDLLDEALSALNFLPEQMSVKEAAILANQNRGLILEQVRQRIAGQGNRHNGETISDSGIEGSREDRIS